MNKLTIENKIQNLDQIAEFIEEFGNKNKLGLKIIFDLNLILDELITNTISYGYKDDEVHTIDIIAETNADVVKLQIIDDGEEFNPLETKEVNIDTPLKDKNIGGLGIHFIKQKADEISYERKENKNILRITKKLKVSGEINGN